MGPLFPTFMKGWFAGGGSDGGGGGCCRTMGGRLGLRLLKDGFLAGL